MPARYRIINSPRATADIEAIHDHIAKDSPRDARAVVAELIRAIDSLEQLPHRHPVYLGTRRPKDVVRRMPVPPFLIYYRVDDKNRTVSIATIRHGRQRPPGRIP